MEHSNTLLRHRTPQSPLNRTRTDTSLVRPTSPHQTNKRLKVIPRHTSTQSIFWTGCFVFTVISIMMLYYTTYHLPSSPHSQQLIADKIDDNQTAPFGLENYPFDTPYELRDISQYSKIVAIGDLHGDLSQTYKILQLSNILDANYEWIARDTILVQTGDVVDRGKESIEIYQLFFKLRLAAKSRNCLVLQILGNHEMMNLGGDFRYVAASELYKYGTVTEWAEIWSMRHKIGYFLRRTPIVRIVGNTVFVHAGIRPDILQIVNNENATNKLNELVFKGNTVENFTLEQYLHEYYDYLTVVSTNGPVWTREFEPRFYNMDMYRDKVLAKKLKQVKRVREDKHEVIEEYLCQQVGKTLDILNVTRMVIGHNVQATRRPKSRCDGKLFSIDVGISCAYGCGLAAVTIDIESDMVSIVAP